MDERIQKILAKSGLGSRRSCELLISAGRVSVNGKIASLGEKADAAKDSIYVDGKLIGSPQRKVYIALYKPRGVLSTVSDPDPRPTVRELVDIPEQVYPVGRLDIESEGLILLTNDGDLTNRLTHPSFGHEKEYRVLVARHPDDKQLSSWRRGIVLADGHKAAPAQVRVERFMGKGAWLRVILREGHKRQIRETGSLLGLPVVKIIRIRIGMLHLGYLKQRQWRYLSSEEVDALKSGKPVKAKSKWKKTHPKQ